MHWQWGRKLGLHISSWELIWQIRRSLCLRSKKQVQMLLNGLNKCQRLTPQSRLKCLEPVAKDSTDSRVHTSWVIVCRMNLIRNLVEISTRVQIISQWKLRQTSRERLILQKGAPKCPLSMRVKVQMHIQCTLLRKQQAVVAMSKKLNNWKLNSRLDTKVKIKRTRHHTGTSSALLQHRSILGLTPSRTSTVKPTLISETKLHRRDMWQRLLKFTQDQHLSLTCLRERCLRCVVMAIAWSNKCKSQVSNLQRGTLSAKFKIIINHTIQHAQINRHQYSNQLVRVSEKIKN